VDKIKNYNVITIQLKQFINEIIVWSINNRYIYKLKRTVKKDTFINEFINEIIKLYNYGFVITHELKTFINEMFSLSIKIERFINKSVP